ncbi:MAG: virulence RhuM family protein [Spirochaetes bacterium]|nr:virulence RhuM family protein [Spirochaetota bacterium]
MNDNHEIIIYQTQDGKTKIDVRMGGETLWLTQAQMVDLFQTSKQNISLHINNVFDEGELSQPATVKDYLTVQKEGAREVKRAVKHYNLDVILAVGYRVKSAQGTQFRQWATAILHEYLQKGFAMNDEKLKEFGGGDYWYELLERIRDIRSSEKALYRQVLDLYATSIDYNPKQPETFKFFKIVQNKMHFAASKRTAAELIFERADSEQPFMGLTSFKGSRPRKTDIDTAKNYMTEDELFVLNRIVSAFFDIAELKARRHEHLYMRDWLAELDKFTGEYGEGTLVGAGKVTHEAALEKANTEYLQYKLKSIDELSPVEREYFQAIKDTQKKLERKKKAKKD